MLLLCDVSVSAFRGGRISKDTTVAACLYCWDRVSGSRECSCRGPSSPRSLDGPPSALKFHWGALHFGIRGTLSEWQLQGLSSELHPGLSSAPPQPQIWLPPVRSWHQGPCPHWDDDMAHVLGVILVVILLSETLCISPGA